jgi:hypothetical protein
MKKAFAKIFFCLSIVALALSNAASAQTMWKVVRLRGEITANGKPLQIDSIISQEQDKIVFSTTYDCMLVVLTTDKTESMLVRPDPFNNKKSEASSCQGKCGVEWVDPMIHHDQYHWSPPWKW